MANSVDRYYSYQVQQAAPQKKSKPTTPNANIQESSSLSVRRLELFDHPRPTILSTTRQTSQLPPSHTSAMRVAALLSALCAAVAVHADPRTAQVYIQPVDVAAKAPAPLAEISYDMAALATSSIASYDAPDLPEAAKLVRIGLYDKKAKAWAAGTTVASADNFSKGFSPTITLSVNSAGDVLSASVKGVQIDAGQTRDFGPKALVLPETKGPQPQLNKPVVLTPAGKKPEEEQEKSFLQK